ncbi:MAG: LCP family protein, partial [Acutalibacteraceae bacterium]
MENKKNSKGSNQSSSKNKATKPKGNPTSKKTVGKKTDNKNNQAKKNSKNTKQKVNKNTKQKVNRANENTIDLEKYSKYIEEHNPSESKSSRAKNNSEMKDVFSDSSMRAGKKPSKFKQSGFYKKWNSLEKWKRTTIIVVAVIFLILGIAYSAIFGILSGFKGEKLNKKDLGISDSSAYKNSDYINIAVFGLDTRSSESFSGRSDSIIIASVNKKNGKIKLTSILRDSYVAIDGYPNQKITHAYSLGGAKLAVKTLNQNYNMNIEDYVSFNFAKLAGLIDLTGGIDIEITQAERNEMNRVGREDGAKYKMVQ